MSKLPIEYLRHIYDECTFILSSISPDMTKDDLIDNEVLKRAIVRSLEIIGEGHPRLGIHPHETFFGFVLVRARMASESARLAH